MVSSPDPSTGDSAHVGDGSTNQHDRPSAAALLSQWHSFFGDPLLSPHTLRQTALSGNIRNLRSLHWRYFFSLLPTPAPLGSASIPSSTWTSYERMLQHARSEYSSLRTTYLRSPDGKWCSDYLSLASIESPKPPVPPKFTANGLSSVASGGITKVQVDQNNPLAIDEGNPWTSWFEDLELRRVIRQDVSRTFPEIAYFHSPQVQDQLTDLLFVFVKSIASDTGYRQGMHELVALVLWIVDFDALPPLASRDGTTQTPQDSDALARLVLCRDHIEHDAWALFTTLMKSAKLFYDPTPSVPLPAAASKTPSSATAAASTVMVQPIVATSARIHDSLLATIDPELHTKLDRLGIEPQLYTIRWLRLLFTREFPVEETLLVWDGIFAEDPNLRMTEFICLAMLLRIRSALLLADYSSCLSLLLRYPYPTSSPDSHQVTHLISQALQLRDSLSPSTAQMILRINEQYGLQAGGSDLLRLERGEDDQPNHIGKGRVVNNGPLAGKGLVGDLAKGVYGRAEALGWTGALQGGLATINDLVNRGIAAQAAARPVARDPLSRIPDRAPWEVMQQPHYQPQETTRPLPPAPSSPSLSISNSLKLSKAIDACVSTLRDGATDSSSSTKDVLDVLMHVRDVLGSSGSVPIKQSVLQRLAVSKEKPKSPLIDENRVQRPSISSTSATSNTSEASSSRAPVTPSSTDTSPPGLGPASLHASTTPSPKLLPASVEGKSTSSGLADPTAISPPLSTTPSVRPKSSSVPQAHTQKSLGLGANARAGPLPLTGFSTGASGVTFGVAEGGAGTGNGIGLGLMCSASPSSSSSRGGSKRSSTLGMIRDPLGAVDA
ncbi:BQ2448_6524 [Microbotryum intermedium]|uniref:BQ2448_6524 protein n=1 Tax=Microbotryum intermedium TaxID=269621 RepID=A0A238FJY1_9BASI|nr:BQ2448_6524 [Microbotryum intermedium]